VPQERLVDELFVEIDRSLERGRTEFESGKVAEGADWLRRIEEENAGELTPERMAKLEAEGLAEPADAEDAGDAADATGGNGAGAGSGTELPQAAKVRLDEEASPTEGRRFTRA